MEACAAFVDAMKRDFCVSEFVEHYSDVGFISDTKAIDAFIAAHMKGEKK